MYGSSSLGKEHQNVRELGNVSCRKLSISIGAHINMTQILLSDWFIILTLPLQAFDLPPVDGAMVQQCTCNNGYYEDQLLPSGGNQKFTSSN